MAISAVILEDRGVVRVSGPEARAFLHGLVTSDVEKLAPGNARHAALLTPQGKILFDFFLAAEREDAFLLDVARDQAEALAKRLGFYKLRAKVAVADLSADHAIAVSLGGAPPARDGVIVFIDPRLAQMGHRLIGPSGGLAEIVAGAEPMESADYHAARIRLGLPEGGRDFVFGDIFPHEADMDQLSGIDFAKGCFVGQEVVSRMQHRGTARRRFVPVAVEGPLPAPGTEVRAGEALIGTMGGGDGDTALALLRLDRADEAMREGRPLTAEGAVLTIGKPDWARFPFPGETGQP